MILELPHVVIIFLLMSSFQFLRCFFFSQVFLELLPATFGGNVEQELLGVTDSQQRQSGSAGFSAVLAHEGVFDPKTTTLR